MRKNKKIVLTILLTVLSIITISLNAYAHSGRTDSNGGHKDNKNKSGLGSYHYHCGGNPAHLHENGVCPYSSNKSSTSNSSTSSKSNTVTTTKPAKVEATGIQINENIKKNMEVGETQKLTATIEPSNVTEKDITWKSSDESVAVITADGAVSAIKSGVVNITASTSNGKTSTIEISIEDIQEEEIPTVIKTSTIVENTSDSSSSNEQDESNPFGTILTLGALGGGIYAYKKYKK